MRNFKPSKCSVNDENIGISCLFQRTTDTVGNSANALILAVFWRYINQLAKS